MNDFEVPPSPDELDHLNLFFARYHVGLAGAYQMMAYKGEPFGNPKIFCHVCFILEVDDGWYLATAGHIFDDLEKKERDGDIVEGFRLTTLTQKPMDIAFDFRAAEVRHINTVVTGVPCKDASPDLDIGLAAIPEETRAALERSGVVRAPIDDRYDVEGYSGFVLFGLPTDLFGPMQSDENQISRDVNPTIVSFNLLPGEQQRQKGQMLVGSFSDNMDTDAHGLSGGLIFGFHFDSDPNNDRFAAVAVQSHWCPEYRRAYGCPIGEFLERVHQEFRR